MNCRECDNYLEGEQREMVELYISKGLSAEDARTIVGILSKDKEIFVDFMMIEELGILPEEENSSAIKNGAYESVVVWTFPDMNSLLILNLLRFFCQKMYRVGDVCVVCAVWMYPSCLLRGCKRRTQGSSLALAFIVVLLTFLKSSPSYISFIIACVFTAFTLFLLGAIKVRTVAVSCNLTDCSSGEVHESSLVDKWLAHSVAGWHCCWCCLWYWCAN